MKDELSGTLIFAATLSLCAAAASAQPGPSAQFGGSWRTAIMAGGYQAAALGGGRFFEADQQGDPILGVFHTNTDQGTEFWTWRQSNANLSSKALRDSLQDAKAGVRQLNTVLPRAGGGSWVVMSRPTASGDAKPVFVFTSGEKAEIFFADIPSEKVYGDEKNPLRLPLKLDRKGEALSAEYGTAAAGTVELHRFSEKGDQILALFEFKKDPAARQPVLDRARVFTDAGALSELFAQPGLAGSAGAKALLESKELLARMGATLESGNSFSVSFDRFGNGQFTLHRGAADKEGSPYLYIIGGQVTEVAKESKNETTER